MTDKIRGVMRQALEALEIMIGYRSNERNPYGVVCDALESLREALAEPVQEPVQEPVHTLTCVCGAGWDIKPDGTEEMAHPPATGREPVAWRVRGYNQFKTGTPGPWRYFDGAGKPAVNTPEGCDFEQLYTAPPQRKPLTDEEIDRIIANNITITDPNLSGAVYMAMRELETAHGITGEGT